MTKTDRRAIMSQIETIEAILRGETIDGVKLGDPGITREWCETTREALAGFAIK